VSFNLSDEAKRGLDDLFFFSNFFYGLTLEEQPHREMCDIIQNAETDYATPYAMLVVPRGCYKTSIVRSALVWKYLRRVYLDNNPYNRIVIGSSTLALTRAILDGVKEIVRAGGYNQRIDTHYQKLWMNRDKGNTGSIREDGIVFAPRIRAGEIAAMVEPNLFIASMRRISTGFHADEAVIDDLNNKENVATDFQRKKSQDYWKLLFPIIGTKDQRGNPAKIIMLCTPWHDDDVRGMIQRSEREMMDESGKYVTPWRILQKSIYNENGSSYFPSKYSLEELENLRRRMGSEEFAANFLCDPVGDSLFVHEDQIRFKSREHEFPKDLRGIRICVDPNQHKDAKELGCYAAIVVAGYDRFWKTYILDAFGSREWNSAQFIDALFDVQERYPSGQIMIEDSHMSHFQHAVTLEEARRSEKAGHPVRLRLNWVPVDTKLSKYERWQKIQPRFRNGDIFFADEIAPTFKTEIKDELIRGRKARFKDFLDALAMTETGFRPRIDRTGQMVAFQRERETANPTAGAMRSFIAELERAN
jgi:hypothetical protein